LDAVLVAVAVEATPASPAWRLMRRRRIVSLWPGKDVAAAASLVDAA
jgi:hypothetical protein